MLATRHRPPQHWPDGHCLVTLAAHPVAWVTWHGATAYARRRGAMTPQSV
ncbi:hypothetical protein [Streptomyces niveus]